MYRLKEIQDELIHVVGWEQSYDPAKQIDPSLAESESGLYFQGAHPLMTLANVQATMPDDFDYQFRVWNPIISYFVGDKVRHDGAVFIAVEDSVGAEPEVSDFNEDFNEEDFGGPWRQYNLVSDFLEKETRNGIATAIQRFLTEKQLDKETKNIFERRTLFDGAGRLAATVNNQSRLVGYEITPVRSMGVTVKIERIGLQFAGGTGTVRAYIFHSNMVEPYRVLDLDYDLGNGGFKWFTVPDLYLPYISSTTNAGGSWYLVYNQDDLPDGMQAISVNKDWSREPCGSCNRGNVQAWRELTKYMGIFPVASKVPEGFSDNPEIWDVQKNIYTNALNYGMNLEVTVGCDLTDFIVSQRAIFANVIQKQVAVNFLRHMAMNPEVRINRNQSNVSRMDVLYEIDGNTQGPRPGGIGYDLAKDYKALKLDTQGLDRICLSCNNKGVRYRTV